MRTMRTLSIGSSIVAVLSFGSLAIAGCSDDPTSPPADSPDASAKSDSSAPAQDASGDSATVPDAADAETPDAADAAIAVAPAAVYTLSNATSANSVHIYKRDAAGGLTFWQSVPTGGKGTGAGLGDQGSLVFDKATSRFFAVNAGDNTISLLTLASDGALTSRSTVTSNGASPISVSYVGDVVYVLNAGDATHPSNVTGFKVVSDALTAIDASTMPLSMDAAGPAQLQFTPDGKSLIVTEKATSKIDTFPYANGLLSKALVKDSAGQTPFGFDFGPGPTLIVSEAFNAGLGATSSYSIGAGGALTTVSASVQANQIAPCWVAVGGSHAYVTNTKSNSVTSYTIGADGKLTLDNADGVAGMTGATPIDEEVTPAGDFLYVLNALGDTSHSISIFKIGSTGALTKVTDFQGQATRGVGLVVR